MYFFLPVDDQCFVCRDREISKELIKCEIKNCNKCYHIECLEGNVYPCELSEINEINGSQSTRRPFRKLVKTIKKCPQHICLTCYNEPRDYCSIEEFIGCILCPIVYHHIKSCIPADAILDDFKMFTCPNHQSRIRTAKVHADWCFTCYEGENDERLNRCLICPSSFHQSCDVSLNTNYFKGKLPSKKSSGHTCFNCLIGRKLHYADIVWAFNDDQLWPGKVNYLSTYYIVL